MRNSDQAPRNIPRILFRVFFTISTIFYLSIFIDEAFPPYSESHRESNLGITMVFVLFVWYAVGYYYLWVNEKKAALLIISWYVGLVLTAFFIWNYGNVTVVIAFPVLLVSILLLVFTWRK